MKKHWTLIIPGALFLSASPAAAIELRDAVQAALQTNPEIRQAVHNKEATQASASRPRACGFRAFRSRLRPAFAS